MSQHKLADAAGVSAMTIKDFEGERRSPLANNLEAIRRVFVERGLEFTETSERVTISAPAKVRR